MHAGSESLLQTKISNCHAPEMTDKQRFNSMFASNQVAFNDNQMFEHTSFAHSHSYDLNGMVIHQGQGMHYGHYWSLARSTDKSNNPKWIEFDDARTKVVDDKDVQMYYGAPPES